MKNIMMPFFIVSVTIIILMLCVIFTEKVLSNRETAIRNRVEIQKESWKVHLYSGGKEVTAYTTVGRIRNHSNNSTISFTDVLSGKEVVISGTFVAEEF